MSAHHTTKPRINHLSWGPVVLGTYSTAVTEPLV